MMKKIFALLAVLGLLAFSSCQSDKKHKPEAQSLRQSQSNTETSAAPENDQREKPGPYNGWGNYILSYLKTDTIPRSFPKYRGQGKEAYRKEGMKWAKKHLDLIKESKRGEIENYEAE